MTVEELIKKLEQIPSNFLIDIDDPECGAYYETELYLIADMAEAKVSITKQDDFRSDSWTQII